ncbi:MAG: hypothetical protein Q6J68_04235 [Thermostichales cyanobacterium SZTDM-1c_bins_54]
MDSTLFYLLVGTGVVSVLTIVYVLIDERNRYRAYQNRPKETAAPPSPAEPVQSAVENTPESEP